MSQRDDLRKLAMPKPMKMPKPKATRCVIYWFVRDGKGGHMKTQTMPTNNENEALQMFKKKHPRTEIGGVARKRD